MARIEELLPIVDDNTPANARNTVELTMMSDVVIDYEKEHYPIGKTTVAQLIQLSLDEKKMSHFRNNASSYAGILVAIL